ncbi:hypothetical protein K2173_005954 [Erythroxylum novogranatense]|uniref:Uncharacterized protein n=1 Tax=Erythroxylum novogranatense TaxID=1862640 RepID=A0AAV8TU83_9ROSI|nr:hypothetical protein K2173_005954 [Erythroxylum novogranatense]
MRAPVSCFTRRMCNSTEEETELRRGPWTLEEDTLLTHYIARHGEGRWNMLAKCAGLKRTGKSCRLRWLNYLKPDIKRGNLTPQEQLLILELHSKWGNRWSKIAQHLPGRTDNEIKNYWRTRVQKQARQLNIESNSKRFVDAVRRFWMPRLIQKVEQQASHSPSSSCLTTLNSQSQAVTSPSIHSTVPSFPTSSNIPQSTFGHYPSLESESEILSSNTNPGDASLTNYSMATSDSQKPHDILENYHMNLFGTADVFCNNSILGDSSYMGDKDFYMDGINVGCLTETGTSFENSTWDCQIGEFNWAPDDLSDTLWNMDDIWQFRDF